MTKTTGNFTDFLDFSRSSRGTSLRRVVYGSELVTNGTFDTDTTGWTTNGDVSVSSGQVTVENDTAAISDIRQTVSVTAGKIYAISFNFADRANAANIRVSIDADQYLYTGDLLAQNITAKGFYSLTFLATGSSAYIRLMTNATTIGHSTTWDNISVKEVTLDAPSGDLVFFNHPNNVPRVDYDADGNVNGLLVEVGRTNLVEVSEVTAEDNVGWSNSSCTPTDLNENALGVFKGVSIASGGVNWHRRNTDFDVTSGTDYVATIFYRAGTSNRLRVVFRNNSGGAVESRVGGEIGSLTVPQEFAGDLDILLEEDLPDNVKKITIKYTPNFTGNLLFGIGPDSSTSGETVIAYGAQVEAGSFATSYIPTTGATATRSKDIASINVDNFGIHDNVGTMVVEFGEVKFNETGSGYPRIIEYGSTTNAQDRINVYIGEPTENLAYAVITNNVNQAGADFTSDNTSPIDAGKVAFAFDENDIAACLDGGTVKTDGSAALSGVANRRSLISFGSTTESSTSTMSGTIKSFQYYPRRLTNAQLQELTS